MARQTATYLSIIDPASEGVLRRWQQGYIGATVSWETAEWRYLPMEADGVTTGDPARMSVTVRVPAIADVLPIISEAFRRGWHAQVRTYEFDAFGGSDAPQATQTLISEHRGRLARMASPSPFTLEVEIGSIFGDDSTLLLPTILDSKRIGVPLRS